MDNSSLNIYRGRKVLITGHTGFKGTWLAAMTYRLGARVFGLSDRVPTEPSHFALGASKFFERDYRCDITDLLALKKAMLEISPDYIFHLAAQSVVSTGVSDPHYTIRNNILTTLNVAEMVRVHFPSAVTVFITSDKCYENSEWCWGYRENDTLGGSDPYSASKASCEIILSALSRTFRSPDGGLLPFGTVRAGNVIGGGDWTPDRIVSDCVGAWSDHRPVELRAPSAIRPWQHVLDPLYGYLLFAYHMQGGRERGEAFNFGPDASCQVSVATLVEKLGRHFDYSGRKLVGGTLGDEVDHSRLALSSDKASFRLGWRPHLDYEKAIDLTGEWYKSYLMNHELAVETTVSQVDYYFGLISSRSTSNG